MIVVCYSGSGCPTPLYTTPGGRQLGVISHIFAKTAQAELEPPLRFCAVKPACALLHHFIQTLEILLHVIQHSCAVKRRSKQWEDAEASRARRGVLGTGTRGVSCAVPPVLGVRGERVVCPVGAASRVSAVAAPRCHASCNLGSARGWR